MGTVGLLLRVCCMCISFAMSSGFVSILLLRSLMQSSGGVSRFLNTFLFIFFGLVSYSFLYLDMAFLMHSLVYLVVIFLACRFDVLAIVAIYLIHVLIRKPSVGGGGMCIRLYCLSVSIIGCICQFVRFFVMYIVFLIM